MSSVAIIVTSTSCYFFVDSTLAMYYYDDVDDNKINDRDEDNK